MSTMMLWLKVSSLIIFGKIVIMFRPLRGRLSFCGMVRVIRPSRMVKLVVRLVSLFVLSLSLLLFWRRLPRLGPLLFRPLPRERMFLTWIILFPTRRVLLLILLCCRLLQLLWMRRRQVSLRWLMRLFMLTVIAVSLIRLRSMIFLVILRLLPLRRIIRMTSYLD